jgi:cytochrome c peroxidase
MARIRETGGGGLLVALVVLGTAGFFWARASEAPGVTTGRSPAVAQGRAQGHLPPAEGQPAVLGYAPKAETPARAVFERRLDTLAEILDTLARVAASGPEHRLLPLFKKARFAYKRVEGLVRYFAPEIAGGLDGPLPEADEDAPPRPLGSPAGFQIVEAELFPATHDSTRRRAQARITGMAKAVRQLRSLTTYLGVGDAEALDAARLELARASTIDLAGVDLENSSNAVVEGATALDGMRVVLHEQAGGMENDAPRVVLWMRVDSTLRGAVAYLLAHPEFEHLDRLTFIAGYARPAAQAVALARASVGGARPALRLLWRPEAATVFDSGAFDAQAYASDYAPRPTPPLVALGERLFNEPRLSGPGTRSCAFCHQRQRAFSDGRAAPQLIGPASNAGPSAPVRRTPTLLNAALEPALFDDERAATLEEQVAIVLRSPTEMASSPEIAAARLRADTSYRSAFTQVFGFAGDSTVSGLRLRIAVAAYVRTLVALNSRFDRAARGDTAMLTPAERHGFNLYMGKARCGICHFAPLFNGVAPTAFSASEPEIIGVPERPVLEHGTLDPDPGRGGVDHIDLHRFAFKVPTLRNIALLAPYMHNGAYATLDQVVSFYNAGGGLGIGSRIPTQTLAARPLHLTTGERADLVAFLRALTDTNVTAAATAIALLDGRR